MAESGENSSMADTLNVPTVHTNIEERVRSYEAQRTKSRINIFEQFGAWRQIRDELKIQSDKQLAKFFIENHLSRRMFVYGKRRNVSELF
jgi:hypothetical protein